MFCLLAKIIVKWQMFHPFSANNLSVILVKIRKFVAINFLCPLKGVIFIVNTFYYDILACFPKMLL